MMRSLFQPPPGSRSFYFMDLTSKGGSIAIQQALPEVTTAHLTIRFHGVISSGPIAHALQSLESLAAPHAVSHRPGPTPQFVPVLARFVLLQEQCVLPLECSQV